jgi:hypothetical protein
MLPLYVIRNTTKDCEHNSHNLFVLIQTVCSFVNQPCEVVVVNSDEQTVVSEYPIINLDPFSRTEDHFALDICRQFSEDQSKPIGFTSRTKISIGDQLKAIPNGKYIIVDDDIASGSTRKFVESITGHLEVIDYLSLLQVWCNNNGYANRKIFDCIDTHDFWGDLPSSGLVVNGKREYYWSDHVDLNTRANLDDKSASIFLRKYLK